MNRQLLNQGFITWVWDVLMSKGNISKGTVKNMLRDPQMKDAVKKVNDSINNLENVVEKLKDLDYDF